MLKQPTLHNENDANPRPEKKQKMFSNADHDSRNFVMGIVKEGGHAGICEASQDWLDFCGLKRTEVLGKEPKDLLQGPLTSRTHPTDA